MGTLSRCFAAALFFCCLFMVSNMVPAHAQRQHDPNDFSEHNRFPFEGQLWLREQVRYPSSVLRARGALAPHRVAPGQVYLPSGTGIDPEMLFSQPTAAAVGMPIAYPAPSSAVPIAAANFGRPRSEAPPTVPRAPVTGPVPLPHRPVVKKVICRYTPPLPAAPAEPRSYARGFGFDAPVDENSNTQVQLDCRAQFAKKHN